MAACSIVVSGVGGRGACFSDGRRAFGVFEEEECVQGLGGIELTGLLADGLSFGKIAVGDLGRIVNGLNNNINSDFIQ